MSVYRVGKRKKVEEAPEKPSSSGKRKKTGFETVKKALSRAEKVKKKKEERNVEEADVALQDPVVDAKASTKIEEKEHQGELKEDSQHTTDVPSPGGGPEALSSPHLVGDVEEAKDTAALEKDVDTTTPSSTSRHEEPTATAIPATEEKEAMGLLTEELPASLTRTTGNDDAPLFQHHEEDEDTTLPSNEVAKEEEVATLSHDDGGEEQNSSAVEPYPYPASASSLLCTELLKWKALFTAPYMIFDPKKNAIVTNPTYDRATAVRLSVLQGKCSVLLAGNPLVRSPLPPLPSTDPTATSSSSASTSIVHEAQALYAVLETLDMEGCLPAPSQQDGGVALPLQHTSETTIPRMSTRSPPGEAPATEEKETLNKRTDVRFAEHMVSASYLLAARAVTSFLDTLHGKVSSSLALGTTAEEKHRTPCPHTPETEQGVIPSSQTTSRTTDTPGTLDLWEWCSGTAKIIRELQVLYAHIPSFREQQLQERDEPASYLPTPTTPVFTTAMAQEMYQRWEQLGVWYRQERVKAWCSFSVASMQVTQHRIANTRGGSEQGAAGGAMEWRAVVQENTTRVGGWERNGENTLFTREEKLPLKKVEDASMGTAPSSSSSGLRVKELLCHTFMEKSASHAVVVFTRSCTAVPWGFTATVSPQGYCYLSMQETSTTPETMKWLEPDRTAAERTPASSKGKGTARVWLTHREEYKLRLLQINYYTVPSHPPSALAAAAAKKLKQKKETKLMEKEKKAWKAHETAVANLLQDVTTRLDQHTTIALNLLIEKNSKKSTPTLSSEQTEEKEDESVPLQEAEAVKGILPSEPPASFTSAPSMNTSTPLSATPLPATEEDPKEEWFASHEGTKSPMEMEREEAPFLVSDVPEEVDEDLLGDEALLDASREMEMMDNLVEKLKETKEKKDTTDSEERHLESTSAVSPSSFPLVENLRSLGEVAEEVGSIAKEQKKKMEKEKETKGNEEVQEMGEEKGEKEGSHSPSKISEAPTETPQEDSVYPALSSSALVFSNEVQLKQLKANVADFTRHNVDTPWRLNVSFTKGEVCMTKLPPIPPNARNHPFCKALQADKDGNVNWVIEAVNGKSLVEVPQSLKRQALETIKKSTSVSFVLRGLHRI